MVTAVQTKELTSLITRWNAAETDVRAALREAVELFHPAIALATSFSPEDTVLTDWLVAIHPAARLFALDTGRLPEETYQVAEATRQRFGVAIEWLHPDAAAVQTLLEKDGPMGFRFSVANRLRCCDVRKVEPLQRALTGLWAWTTGQRRSQSVTRQDLQVAELDAAHGGILKLNPLAHWSSEKVWEHIRQHGLPYNKLFTQGYQSIGCAPCSRAVRPGEDERAGRWWWESAGHKECGLHT